MTNENLLQIENVDIFVRRLKRRYLAHVIRGEDEGVAKQAVFSDDYRKNLWYGQ